MKQPINRLAVIAAICGGQLTHVVNVSPSEIATEAALAKSHDDEQSTLDESDNVTVLSPRMVALGELSEHYGDEDLALPPDLSKRLFKTKAVAPVEVEEPITEPLDYEGLEKWAEAQCMEPASVAV